ncbi:MAG: ABC transporter permease, partial [Pseudomonadota bacterium]
MWNRIYALFVARNLEFFRDRSAVAWGVFLPVLIIFVFAYAFTEDNPEKYKVGIVSNGQIAGAASEFESTRFIKFLAFDEVTGNLEKVERHQIDLLFEPATGEYWINRTSPNGYIVEKLLQAAYARSNEILQRNEVEGDEIRYVDWVIPGVIAMNIMWGALFGIGYVIVRYRKFGVLKRLRATPVTAFEFLSAQILSRLWLLV